jgi:hypothetical protein
MEIRTRTPPFAAELREYFVTLYASSLGSALCRKAEGWQIISALK